jgi:serine protease Do
MTVSPLPLILALSLPALSWADDLSGKSLEELQQRMADLESEKQKIASAIQRLSSPSPTALILADGTVNPRISNAIVIIQGDTSTGTGFIIRTEGLNYLYTAAHVLSGNRKLSIKNSAGTTFKKFGNLEAAEGADLIRILITEEVQDSLALTAPDTTLSINTTIAALGNGGGNGVVAVESGTILGTSADFLEISAAVIQGNSGGPVIETKSGQAVGVVTHLSTQRDDLWAKGTRQAEVRRFACRLNKPWKWQTKTIAAFLAEGTALVEYDRITMLSLALSQLELLPTGMRLDKQATENETILDVINQNLETEIVRSVLKMNTELSASRTTLSPADLNKKFRSILQQIEFQVKRSSEAFQPKGFAWYHADHAETSLKRRANSITALDLQMERLK